MLRIAAVALLFSGVMLVHTPGFADRPIEWLELYLLSVAGLGIGLGIGALAGRVFGGRSRLGAEVGFALIAALAFTLLGWVCAGWPGSVVGLLPLLSAWLPAAASTAASRPGSSWWRSPVPGALAACLVLVGLELFVFRVTPPPQAVIMVGIDGATGTIIDRLSNEGRLPTLSRMIEEGAHGDLETLNPIISPPIWTSIASGVRPERHGIRDFWAASNRVRSKRLWEIADEGGLRSGVFGYLVTWPPEKAEGFLVPGWLAQGPETVPAELGFYKELELGEKEGVSRSPLAWLGIAFRALRHGATLRTINYAIAIVSTRVAPGVFGEYDARAQFVDVRILKLRLGSDVFCHLVRRYGPHLAIYYDSTVDAIEHLYFKYYEPERYPDLGGGDIAAFGDAIPRAYEEADRALSRIRSLAADDTTFVVVSDHGQRVADFELDAWGSIKTEALIDYLELADEVRATKVGEAVLLRPVDDLSGLEAAIDRLGDVLTLPDEEPLFVVARHDDESAELKLRPGYVVGPEMRLQVDDESLTAELFVGESERVSGIHTDTAFFLIHGPSIRAGTKLSRGSVLDVAPTVLYQLGLPIARDLSGRLRRSAYRPEVLAAREPESVESFGVPMGREDTMDSQLDERTRETLRALGYIE